MPKSGKNKNIYRSAKDGKFVKKDYAEKHPNTTVKETIRKPSKKNK
jgi:hypothetical protein